MRYPSSLLSVLLVSSVVFAVPAIAEDAPAEQVATPAAEAPAEQAATPTEEAPAAAASSESNTQDALVTIRFNKKRVYFERSLRQAITAAENTRAGVHYSILSRVPGNIDAHGEQKAKEQLADVLKVMLKNGVMQSRIQARMETSPDVTSHEVQIFVK